METTIILILSISLIILSICLMGSSNKISKLVKLLDKMDIALAKQHSVIDNQQALIDEVTRGAGDIPKSE